MVWTVPDAGLGTVAIDPLTRAMPGPFTVTPTLVVTAHTTTPATRARQHAKPIQARVRVTTMASSKRSLPDWRGARGTSVGSEGGAGCASGSWSAAGARVSISDAPRAEDTAEAPFRSAPEALRVRRTRSRRKGGESRSYAAGDGRASSQPLRGHGKRQV